MTSVVITPHLFLGLLFYQTLGQLFFTTFFQEATSEIWESECDFGFFWWNPSQNKCVPVDASVPTALNQNRCPPGLIWDAQLRNCATGSLTLENKEGVFDI